MRLSSQFCIYQGNERKESSKKSSNKNDWKKSEKNKRNDGNTNEIFHVLIHELAHCTVEEYSHSQQFWDNYIELPDMCVELGIYKKIPEKTKFCGQHVQDK